MEWPYEIILDLTTEDKAARREALDTFGGYAHHSAFVPPAIYLLCRLFSWTLGLGRRSTSYDALSFSARSGRVGSGLTWQRVKWWLETPVSSTGKHGRRDEWVFGIAWASWLLTLCIIGTGNDYAHLTKRFGIVAASQIPIQTLLSLKAINPFALAFRSSHEEVNRFHRVLGRVIYAFLCLHVLFYLNLFYRLDRLPSRLFDATVLPGDLAIFYYTLLMGSAMPQVRKYSYRLFFIAHLVVIFSTSAFLFLHAKSARFYVIWSLVAFILDLTVRKLTTVTVQTRVEAVPGTDLIKISARLPSSKVGQFRELPGSHVYVSIPWTSRPAGVLSSMVFEFCFNPFTVAEVKHKTSEIILVARQHGGPLSKRLAQLARETSHSFTDARIPLSIEGPFGAFSKTLPSLADPGIDRVLLVAGGVGATFALPVYKSLKRSNPSARVELTWAVRLASDASWASTLAEAAAASQDGSGAGLDVLDDSGVRVFVTGKYSGTAAGTDSGLSAVSRSSSVEMLPLAESRDGGSRRAGQARSYERGRPNIRHIVDDVFKDEGEGSRVAVVVCGPEEMVVEVRESVAPWVARGRDVVWHCESFGW